MLKPYDIAAKEMRDNIEKQESIQKRLEYLSAQLLKIISSVGVACNFSMAFGKKINRLEELQNGSDEWNSCIDDIEGWVDALQRIFYNSPHHSIDRSYDTRMFVVIFRVQMMLNESIIFDGAGLNRCSKDLKTYVDSLISENATDESLLKSVIDKFMEIYSYDYLLNIIVGKLIEMCETGKTAEDVRESLSNDSGVLLFNKLRDNLNKGCSD